MNMTASSTCDFAWVTVADELVAACAKGRHHVELVLDVIAHAACADAGMVLGFDGHAMVSTGMSHTEAEHISMACRCTASGASLGRITLPQRSLGYFVMPLMLCGERIGSIVLCTRDVLMRTADLDAAQQLMSVMSCSFHAMLAAEAAA